MSLLSEIQSLQESPDTPHVTISTIKWFRASLAKSLCIPVEDVAVSITNGSSRIEVDSPELDAELAQEILPALIRKQFREIGIVATTKLDVFQAHLAVSARLKKQ